MSNSSSIQASIAAHRFGLGEPSLQAIESDPQGWLLAQIGAADAARGDALLTTRQALDLIAAEREKRRLAQNPPPGMTAEQLLAGHYREATLADARSHLASAALTERPLMERLQLFWCNHFTVSLAKGSVRGLVGAFERDAIRPHIAGRFEDLLYAAITHPAMLRYLDNSQSAGPGSRAVAVEARRSRRTGETPRVSGLNENLAREVLELHTLGAESNRAAATASGGYTQADVTSFARVLTGWRIGADAAESGLVFDPNWHEPGPKTLLGRTYAEGPEALGRVVHDLAAHPSTAHFIATKLARHVVADEPAPALVDRLAAAYRRSDGDLPTLYRELIRSPEAWNAQASKLKTPEEFVLSSVRVLGLRDRDLANVGGAIGTLGQRLHAAPSPAGWSDRADDWLGPDAVWKRIEWATRLADRIGPRLDARALAAQSLGARLGAKTQLQIDRAADASQALALLLMAPEFQRR